MSALIGVSFSDTFRLLLLGHSTPFNAGEITIWTASAEEVRELDQRKSSDVTCPVPTKVLARTPNQLVLRVFMSTGERFSTHAPACDIAGAMPKSRAKAIVAGQVLEFGPGDGSHHPRDTHHHIETLLDSLLIEITCPPASSCYRQNKTINHLSSQTPLS
jgi:hypothetical protein